MTGSTDSAGSAGSGEAPAGSTASAKPPVPEPRRAAGAAATIDGLREVLRTRGGWLVGLCGVLLCALGWYGVSGERYEARQVPYLASATIPGAALIVAGAVLVVGTRRDGPSSPGRSSASDASVAADASGSSGSSDAELRLVMGQLYRLLVEPAPAAGSFDPPAPAADAPWVTVPGGARYHRRGCSLVRGKNGVHPVDETMALNRDLRPCRVCDPGALSGSGDPADPGRGAPARLEG